ncbi:hypothetical protein BDV12DRAFT_201597 [Aspergillus spectabilis]
MPSRIHEDEYDVPMLSESDTDDILDPTATAACPEIKSYLFYLTSLTMILADIQATYYTVKAVNRTSNDLEFSLEAARSTRAHLKEWRNHLPESLKRRQPNIQANSQDLDGTGSLTYWAPYVTLVSVYQANIAGHTKKTVLYAWFFVGWAVGNIIGPQTFRADQAPAYTGGTVAMIVCYGVAIAMISAYGIICHRENKRREALDRPVGEQDWLDLTDKQNQGLGIRLSIGY